MRYHQIDSSSQSPTPGPVIRAKERQSPAITMHQGLLRQSLRLLGYTYDSRLELWIHSDSTAVCFRDGQLIQLSETLTKH